MTVAAQTSRADFIDAVGRATIEGRGYAAGKICESERAWLYYPMLVKSGASRLQRRAYEQALFFRALRAAGAFPGNAAFYCEFADFYARRLRTLDCVGVQPGAAGQSLEILRFHSVDADLIPYLDQEPDRSVPADDSRCYLPYFRGKRVLLVCPFASVLARRADRNTFEAVWAKTGKRWFEPASVEALEFPYGFDQTTRDRYATCLDLLADIERRMEEREYDVALIAAGALGIPLASHARAHGKVGLSLGGALQVLFGVYGDRWAARSGWREQYFTPAWIRVPEEYRPDTRDTTEDYW